MRKTPLLCFVIGGLLALAPGCDRADQCSDCAPGKAHAAKASTAAASTIKKLEPWDTYDELFAGCAGGCGMRMTGPTEGVVAQPGVVVGQHTYCPVSGVAFEIKATSAHRKVGETTLYFCCESCAAYFTANQASILAARGFAA
jgi:hypothetical protein